MTETELVTAVLTHAAGFDISLFGGMVCARSTDAGTFCVSWNPNLATAGDDSDEELEFSLASDAAAFFVQKRQELRVGADLEHRF